jgi:hypothetical protein
MTFSGDAKNDGLWIGEIDGPRRTKMSTWGGYRWHADSSSIWVLDLTAEASGQDHVVQIDARTGLVIARTQIAGRVRDQRWEIDPSGRAIAYWREQDGRVVIEPLRP